VILVAVVFSCKKDPNLPTGSNKIEMGQTIEDTTMYHNSVVTSSVETIAGNTISQHGHCWSTNNNPTIEDSHTNLGGLSSPKSFTSELDSLEPNTKYYVRLYLNYSHGIIYGEEISITTLKTGIPTVNTSDVTSITLYTAQCGGNAIADSGLVIITKGICWDTTSNVNIENNIGYTTDGDSLGMFISEITGLLEGVNYYVKAYSTNEMGTSYGEAKQFTTVPITLPEVTTTDISEITINSGVSGGNVTSNGNGTVSARGVCWNTNGNPTLENNLGHTINGSEIGVFTSNISGLTENTTYYVTAYATNEKGTSYGEQKSFETTALEVPTVNTTIPTNITINSAVSGGEVTNEGNSSVTVRGIVWSTNENPTIESNMGITENGSGLGVFVSDLTDLQNVTLYYVRAYATNEKGTGYGEVFEFTTLEIVLPEVITSNITNLTMYSAQSGGNVISIGNDSVTARGICWSTSNNPTITDNHTSDGSGTGIFESSITGLSSTTQYYARAYAVNSAGTAYGNEISFTTLSNVILPSVTTDEAINISQTAASSGGNVTSNGGGTVSARGVCWGTSPNPSLSDNFTQDGSSTGVFVSNIAGLTQNTTYYIRAYATNAEGTAYGNQVSFNTLADPVLPTVSTDAVINITQTTANSGGNVTSDGGADVTARGVCWSNTSVYPDIDDPHTTDGTSTGIFVSLVMGLTPNTFYYLRSYATNSVGTSYGNTQTFMTLDTQTIPTVTTAEGINISQTEATTGGTVHADGGATVTARGVCYSTSANPSLLDDHTTNGTGLGAFVSTLTSLTPNTQYYVRSYATNSEGTAYGNEITFITLSDVTLPTVTTDEATNITQTTATSGGEVTDDGGADVTARGVCWSISNNPTIGDNYTTNGNGTGVFVSSLTGLTQNTNYFVRAYATNSEGTEYGNEITFNTINDPVLPSVTTDTAINITQTTAISGGEVTDDGGADVTARGVCWSNQQNPDLGDSHTTDGTGTGVFTSLITELTPNSYYYVRAYATNSVGTTYGNQQTFMTLDTQTIPTVTTDQSSNISQTEATTGGTVHANGGATVTARGVCYSTSSNPTLSDAHTSDGTGLGTFVSSLSGLNQNTQYYVRSYATNSEGTAYGNEITFITLSDVTLPTVTTDEATNITQTTATSGGDVTDDGGATVTARGVCYSISSNPTLSDAHTSDGTGLGTFVSSLSGLNQNTQYYVRSYATNSEGTAYGNEITFITLSDMTIPTVTTYEASNITQTTATSGGDVTDDGGATVTARGVCWSTSSNPTLADSYTTDGSGTGTFGSSISGLTQNTNYYVRAYATNSEGTAYGNEITFTTLMEPVLPTVTTDNATNITSTTATSGGNVTDDGGADVTARGVCWSISSNPTLADSYTTDGTGTGTFFSELTGLAANTLYYVRAYATNGVGTAYGNEISFTTLLPSWQCGDLLSYEGQDYTTVLIGTQCWMAENLNIGTRIDGSQNQTNNSQIEKYCYDDNESNCDTYGGLYQWDEMMEYTTAQGAQGICPSGWHIPTDDEWKILEGTVDSQYGVGDPEWDIIGWRGFDVGFNLKSTSGWWGSTGNGSDIFGFTALPNGQRDSDGNFNFVNKYGYWQSSTEYSELFAWIRVLGYDKNEADKATGIRGFGYSVRCLKD